LKRKKKFYLFLQFICLALQGQLVCAGFGHSRHEQKTVWKQIANCKITFSFFLYQIFICFASDIAQMICEIKMKFQTENLPDNSLETINLLEIVFGLWSIIEFKSQARQFSWITKKKMTFFLFKIASLFASQRHQNFFLTSSQISIKLKRWRRFGNNRFLMIRGKTI
jgi:hypothetical protein